MCGGGNVGVAAAAAAAAATADRFRSALRLTRVPVHQPTKASSKTLAACRRVGLTWRRWWLWWRHSWPRASSWAVVCSGKTGIPAAGRSGCQIGRGVAPEGAARQAGGRQMGRWVGACCSGVPPAVLLTPARRCWRLPPPVCPALQAAAAPRAEAAAGRRRAVCCWWWAGRGAARRPPAAAAVRGAALQLPSAPAPAWRLAAPALQHCAAAPCCCCCCRPDLPPPLPPLPQQRYEIPGWRCQLRCGGCAPALSPCRRSAISWPGLAPLSFIQRLSSLP